MVNGQLITYVSLLMLCFFRYGKSYSICFCFFVNGQIWTVVFLIIVSLNLMCGLNFYLTCLCSGVILLMSLKGLLTHWTLFIHLLSSHAINLLFYISVPFCKFRGGLELFHQDNLCNVCRNTCTKVYKLCNNIAVSVMQRQWQKLWDSH